MKDNKALKYLTLITGVLTLLLGVYTLVRPMRTFLAIGWILGILLFVNGIELVILSLSKEKKEIGACILGVLEGLAGIILLFSGIQPVHHRRNGSLYGRCNHSDLRYFPDCRRHKGI